MQQWLQLGFPPPARARLLPGAVARELGRQPVSEFSDALGSDKMTQ